MCFIVKKSRRLTNYRNHDYGRTTFIDPREIQAIVPYWTHEQAQECAAIVHRFSKKYYEVCVDPIYEFRDFVMLCYVGILVLKRKIAITGGVLTPYKCQGYIQGYARQEWRRQEILRKLNLTIFDIRQDVTKFEDFVTQIENDEAAKKTEKDEKELRKYILDYAANMYRFANDFLASKDDKTALKKKYGKDYAALKKKFLGLAKEFFDADDD